MNSLPRTLPCDGCGLPASPDHIAARVRHLELATRFRPIHIGILFVAFAPASREEDDFYAPAQSKTSFDPFLEALAIPPTQDGERLAEFQKRGHFLAYLSECPLPPDAPTATAAVDRLAPNLIRRIRFNYKPKHVVLMGRELTPLVEILRNAGIGPSLILHGGLPLPFPGTGAKDWQSLFRSAVASASPSQYPETGYDRITFNPELHKSGAGGGT